jgi:hypothetical protein
MTTPDERPAAPIPPWLDWVVRHSGKIIFATVLLAALLEGVGIYYSRRRAEEQRSAEPMQQPERR